VIIECPESPLGTRCSLSNDGEEDTANIMSKTSNRNPPECVLSAPVPARIGCTNSKVPSGSAQTMTMTRKVPPIQGFPGRKSESSNGKAPNSKVGPESMGHTIEEEEEFDQRGGSKLGASGGAVGLSSPMTTLGLVQSMAEKQVNNCYTPSTPSARVLTERGGVIHGESAQQESRGGMSKKKEDLVVTPGLADAMNLKEQMEKCAYVVVTDAGVRNPTFKVTRPESELVCANVHVKTLHRRGTPRLDTDAPPPPVTPVNNLCYPSSPARPMGVEPSHFSNYAAPQHESSSSRSCMFPCGPMETAKEAGRAVINLNLNLCTGSKSPTQPQPPSSPSPQAQPQPPSFWTPPMPKLPWSILSPTYAPPHANASTSLLDQTTTALRRARDTMRGLLQCNCVDTRWDVDDIVPTVSSQRRPNGNSPPMFFSPGEAALGYSPVQPAYAQNPHHYWSVSTTMASGTPVTGEEKEKERLRGHGERIGKEEEKRGEWNEPRDLIARSQGPAEPSDRNQCRCAPHHDIFGLVEAEYSGSSSPRGDMDMMGNPPLINSEKVTYV